MCEQSLSDLAPAAGMSRKVQVVGWRSVSALGLWECVLNIWNLKPVQRDKGGSTFPMEGRRNFDLKMSGDIKLGNKIG